MMQNNNLRASAVDNSRSFLVVAPAGSGKTSLLVERYLNLLTTVNDPSMICAITFTRKAAKEMRSRILKALYDDQKPELTKIQQYVKQKQWNLLDNPHLLKIQTIDSFIHSLVKPSGQLLDKEATKKVYQEVVQLSLNELSVPNLRFHLDNRLPLAEKFFVDLLAKRGEWAYQLLPLSPSLLEEGLTSFRKKIISAAQENLEPFFEAFKTSFAQLNSLNPEIPPWIVEWLKTANAKELPLATLKEFAAFCLTKEETVRKTWTKAQYFTVTENAIHHQLKELKKTLTNLTLKLNLPSLVEILRIPDNYSPYQLEILQEIFSCLRQMLARIKLYFKTNQVFDYTELTLEALAALEGDQKEEFLYRWSNSIQHLLIDEFQDTAYLHYRFLNKITDALREDSSKTLFLVGDPMQSIYKFRGAEVGLFLKAQQNELFPVTTIKLTENFRSSATLIQRFNQLFAQIFPISPAINLGAIPYTPSTATQQITGNFSVCLLKNGTLANEAEEIWQIIQKLPEQETKAILVKSRNHLPAILTILEQHQYSYQGYELIKLVKSNTVRDLVSLIRSLADLTDPIAWISLLRSTWCGLTPETLSKIPWNTNHNCWELLQTVCVTDIMEQKRLQFLLNALKPFIPQIRILDWQTLIFQSWLQLTPVNNSEQLYEVEQVLNCIDKGELNLPLMLGRIKEKFLSKLQTTPSNLQIMTIHNAKGLEFGTVIVPGMNQTSPANESQLINWWELPEKTKSQLLVGIFEPNLENNSLHRYINKIQNDKEKYEQARLLYVTCTRAKSNLFLIGSGNKIRTNSFFDLMKPIWDPNWEKVIPETTSTKNSVFLPTSSRYKNIPPQVDNLTVPFKYWESFWSTQEEVKRAIGNLVHYLLYEIVVYGKEKILNYHQLTWQRLAEKFNLDLKIVFAILKRLIKNLEHPVCKWILKPRPQQHQEWKISNGKQILVLDHVFYEEDTHWIFDYKTNSLSKFPPNDLNFLVEKYRPQLLTYFLALKPHFKKIRLGLFFPLKPTWIEVKCD